MIMFESEIANLYTAAIMVFAALVPVLNPFGGAMFFLTLTNGVDPHIRGAMANRIGLYSLIVLLVCLFAGNIILNFFGISIGVLRMAGFERTGTRRGYSFWSTKECSSPLHHGLLPVYIAADDRSRSDLRCCGHWCDSL